MPHLLIVDDEPGIRSMLSILLQRSGYDVTVASGIHEADKKLEKNIFDLVITDLMMPDGSGMALLEKVRSSAQNTQVIMITAYATTSQAVEAMKLGAYDYVQKPFKNDELLATIEKALEKQAIVNENRALREQVRGTWSDAGILGKGTAIQRVRELVKRVANAPASVLITGESGTGKEVVARSIHHESDRHERPFIVVNCGALPENLMESELFGHEKGSFTGANTSKEGLFRSAQGGTIFLDEIGELPLPLQVKLLRVLQEKSVRPVGGSKETPIDVRVVAATNRDLESDVRANTFRQDLFYRLNVIRIHLPPLRDRREDIPILAEHFLTRYSAISGRQLTIGPDVMRWLTLQPFEGNIRELENTIERVATLCIGHVLSMDDVPDIHIPRPQEVVQAELGPNFDLEKYLADIERSLLERALVQADGVRTKAAQLLGMSFRQFRYRFAKYSGEEIRESDVGE